MQTLDWDRILPIVPPLLERERLHQIIHGKCIVVTGAGGSVGSLLARTLTDFAPGRLVLIDQSEYGLHSLQQMLRESEIAPQAFRLALGDVSDPRFVEKIFLEEKPHTVFHAAAYKHVPISEENAHVVIQNNLAATLSLLKSSVGHHVSIFIHISSDKSVEPIGVMGATKRLSELLVCAFRKRGFQRYYSIRFGNILGSSGSLTESICEDLVLGKTLFVTDAKMTRWFTTPKLVAHSLLMSLYENSQTDVLIPKCHREKNILDLVREIARVILGKDSLPHIQYIGARPGEKQSEKLFGTGDELVREGSWFNEIQLIQPVPPNELLNNVSALIEDARQYRRGLLTRVQACLATEEGIRLPVSHHEI